MAEFANEDAQFRALDAEPKNTLMVFDSEATANRYLLHQQQRWQAGEIELPAGVICRINDTRTGSGLCTQWRDPVPLEQLKRRQAEARWLLEEVLAGRQPRPVAGQSNRLDLTRPTTPRSS